MEVRITRIAIILLLAGFLSGQAAAEVDAEFDMEPLRDPFWPVGYFPENWKADQSEDPATAAAQVESDWSVPESRLEVTGTSRLGSKAAAIINGHIREVGDVIEMIHSNRIYKWKLTRVNPNGTVALERLEVANRTLGFQPGDKK